MKSFRLRLTSLPYSVIIMENKKWRTGMADPELSLHWFRFVGGIYYEKTLLNSCSDYYNCNNSSRMR